MPFSLLWRCSQTTVTCPRMQHLEICICIFIYHRENEPEEKANTAVWEGIFVWYHENERRHISISLLLGAVTHIKRRHIYRTLVNWELHFYMSPLKGGSLWNIMKLNILLRLLNFIIENLIKCLRNLKL